mmetsp:Transcript_23302/g.59565  ORF Transcript_23302/g.59565 Transcript_23302/m.59565 type:complete len:243 (-) Transcript_23302:1968-2696(-)
MLLPSHTTMMYGMICQQGRTLRMARSCSKHSAPCNCFRDATTARKCLVSLPPRAIENLLQSGRWAPTVVVPCCCRWHCCCPSPVCQRDPTPPSPQNCHPTLSCWAPAILITLHTLCASPYPPPACATISCQCLNLQQAWGGEALQPHHPMYAPLHSCTPSSALPSCRSCTQRTPGPCIVAVQHPAHLATTLPEVAARTCHADTPPTPRSISAAQSQLGWCGWCGVAVISSKAGAQRRQRWSR